MSSTSIGPRALAQLTGVSTDTLRHYERLGLLPGTARTPAGYRRYSVEAADRVRLIQRALVVGFSLKELAQVLGACQKGSPPCGRVRSLVGARLDRLEARLKELIDLRDDLRTLLEDWDARLASTPAGQRARLLDMLDGRPALDRAGTRARVGRIDL
ncbi:MAG TPA: MerR family transcriptional regulator [Vicinamibacterales bacterium]|nr:MerR family transcriptional regulator [Vicinamibacterales bacterium]